MRPWITLTVFPLIVVLLAFASRADAWALALFAAALAAGAALGRYGLAKTQFEATRQGLFYTPHAPLGIALLALFAGRILYRVVELARLPPGTAPALGSAPHPLTLAIFGLLAGYYMSYAVGIVLWRRAVLRRAAARRGEA